MSFERVSLNGSVLPAKWDWDKYRTHQVRELRNARAQKDIPVGILCSALRSVRMLDIGTAGYSGFQIPFGVNSESFFYAGGHSATVTGKAREDILSFLVNGCASEPCPHLLPEDQKFSRLLRWRLVVAANRLVHVRIPLSFPRLVSDSPYQICWLAHRCPHSAATIPGYLRNHCDFARRFGRGSSGFVLERASCDPCLWQFAAYPLHGQTAAADRQVYDLPTNEMFRHLIHLVGQVDRGGSF